MKHKLLKIQSILAVLISISIFLPCVLLNVSATTGKFEKLSYKIENNQVIITDCDYSAINVVIPDYIQDYPVTIIDYQAFYYCENLISIKISNNIIKIDDKSFKNCIGLKSVQIGDSVKNIGNEAFSDCSNLLSIKIPDNVEKLGWNAFFNCSNLESVTLGSGLTKISDSTFYNCKKLSYVDFGKNITTIEPLGFYFCNSLKSITLGNSVTTIGENAFGLSMNLESITIPKSVTNINNSAFYYCIKLNTVNYTGTENEFKKIYIGSDNSKFTDATINYNYSSPLFGDTNSDNICDIKDLIHLKKKLSIYVSGDNFEKILDINKDLIFSSADLVALRKIIF